MKLSISNKWSNKVFEQKVDVENTDIFNGVYIPKEYRKRIIRHLILNYSSNINGMQPALFLAIQGHRGEGKTFMLQTLCESLNIEMKYLSGSDLCGPNEGDSENKIKKEYEAACVKLAKTRKLSVMVIDDFHLSIASDLGENVSKTTNSQVLVGYLMNLADTPYLFNVRIPIVILGNNFRNMYPALIRNGRMDFLTWAPDLDEKIKIVYFMFKKFYPQIKFEDIRELVSNYPNKYIAFFKDVIQDMFFSDCDLIVREFEQRQGNIRLDEINELVRRFIKVDDNISFEHLSNVAAMRNSIKEDNFE